MPKKSYRRKSSNMVKQTPEQKILEHLLLIKDQVIVREVLPFDVGRFAYMPFNAFTKHSYRGMYNLLMLMMQCFSHGWEDPRFVTVGKAKEIKADFRKQSTTMLWGPRNHQGTQRGDGRGRGQGHSLPRIPRVQRGAVRQPRRAGHSTAAPLTLGRHPDNGNASRPSGNTRLPTSR